MDELPFGHKPPRDFFEEALKERLSLIPAAGQAAFAFACAVRLMPSFYQWHQDVLTVAAAEVREVFDETFAQIKFGTAIPDKDRLLLTADELLEYMPNEDSPWSRMRPIAEDAIAALSYTMRSLATSNPQEAVWAARRAYEAADQLAIFDISGERGSLPPESALISHPIVQTELDRQERDISLILDGKSSVVLDRALTESILVV